MQGFWFGRPLAAKEASKLLHLNDSEEAMAKPKEAEILSVNEEREENDLSSN